jgi:hypothetical protein
MRAGILGILGAACAACGGAAISSAPPVSKLATPAASLEEPEDCKGGAAGPSLEGDRVRELFGDAAVSVLSAPMKVEAFRMRVDPVRETPPPNAERIAGYLAAGPGKPVSSDVGKKLADLVLDGASYDFGERTRCEIGALYGFRFTKDALSVELAFELRGERMYVATVDEPYKGRAWSARFTPARAKVLDVLRGAFEGDRELAGR